MSRRSVRLLVGSIVLLVVFFVAVWAVGTATGRFEDARLRDALAGLARMDGGGAYAALGVGGMLAADLFLPVPSSLLMILSGALFGTVAGTAVSFGGAMAGALLAFLLCRRFGRAIFLRFAGKRDAREVERWIAACGPWMILLSRPVPLMTEVVSCLAGLGAMSVRRFTMLSAAGTLPICAVYAWLGAGQRSAGAGGPESASAFPWLLAASLVVPALGYFVIRARLRAVPAAPAPPGNENAAG